MTRRLERLDTPYLVLACLLVALMASDAITQTIDGSWVGDFWEHSAVVRELARHPFHPMHPLFDVDKPHEFYSPYALFLGIVSRLSRLSAVAVLASAGIGNLVLLLTALPPFVRLFTAERRAPFFALLFTLFLWGRIPWAYSGFLHFDVLGSVLPYPSTFSLALTLWTVVVWVRYLDDGRWWRLALVAMWLAIITLSHPPTAIVPVVLIGAFALARGTGRFVAVSASLSIVLAFVAVVAVLWPYYPFPTLIREQGLWEVNNEPLYVGVFTRIFPCLLGLLTLPPRLRANRRDPLVISAATLAAVYGIGYATSDWNVGRVLPSVILLLDIASAAWVARWATQRRSVARPVAVVGVVLVSAAAFMSLQSPIARAVPRAILPSLFDRYRSESVGSAYAKLYAGTATTAVTMATEATGWAVPTYGTKIVAPLNPQAFISDLEQRESDVSTFFAPTTADAERRLLLCRYHASYVLIDRRDNGTLLTALERIGQIWRTDGPFVLLKTSLRC